MLNSMTFWWIMLFVKHNIYGVQNGTVLYPFLDMLEYFQTKIQNFSIAILKNFSFPKLSRSWKMALSISITFQSPYESSLINTGRQRTSTWLLSGKKRRITLNSTVHRKHGVQTKADYTSHIQHLNGYIFTIGESPAARELPQNLKLHPSIIKFIVLTSWVV